MTKIFPLLRSLVPGIMLFYASEILNFIWKFSIDQLILLSLVVTVLSIRYVRYFIVNNNWWKIREHILVWFEQNNYLTAGKTLTTKLEQNLRLRLGLAAFSIGILRYLPRSLTSLVPALVFMAFIIVYPCFMVAFRKEMLKYIVFLYVLIPFVPYAIVIRDYYLGDSLLNFEVANQLFVPLLIAAMCIILFWIFISFITGNTFRIFFNTLKRIFIKLFNIRSVKIIKF